MRHRYPRTAQDLRIRMNPEPSYRIVVAALLRQADQILLVKQQGPSDPAPSWGLPGGVVKADEPLGEALRREISEETGLQLLELGRVLYAAQAREYKSGRRTTSFIFEAKGWQGEIAPADPDDLILDARFLPLETAIKALETLPWSVMREPAVAYLQGQTSPGALWLYRIQQDGQTCLVERIQGWEAEA